MRSKIMLLSVGATLLFIILAGLAVNVIKSKRVDVVWGDYGLVRMPSGTAVLVRMRSNHEVIIVPENASVLEVNKGVIAGSSLNQGQGRRYVVLAIDDRNTAFGNLPENAYFKLDATQHKISWFEDASFEKAIEFLPDSRSGQIYPVKITLD